MGRKFIVEEIEEKKGLGCGTIIFLIVLGLFLLALFGKH